MKKNILLIEDDPILGKTLKLNLEIVSYNVTWNTNLKDAEKTFNDNFDLVILDLGLPDGNGLIFLKKIRSNDYKTPVIILTAQTDENTVVSGLMSGANDYVKKPFGNKELMARIIAALRGQVNVNKPIKDGELELNIEQRKLLFKNSEIKLSRREFDLFKFLFIKKDSIICRETLMRELNIEAEIFDRTIDSHISHLRKKIKETMSGEISINSIYGVGYRLEKNNK